MDNYTTRKENGKTIITLGPGTWTIEQADALVKQIGADRYELGSHVTLQGNRQPDHYTTIRLKKRDNKS